ncbi:hypothetical protein Y1Q_0009352 [Alligator mississippiensis]|uniref:Uncharacterized protein n=1 Tax=Alligator mississippiensis TaxID=8496 RepID=A0A151N7L4_ALLMI|nr:hypothetical protein Y1Q_0009352 [Alligator mississippiensis]
MPRSGASRSIPALKKNSGAWKRDRVITDGLERIPFETEVKLCPKGVMFAEQTDASLHPVKFQAGST